MKLSGYYWCVWKLCALTLEKFPCKQYVDEIPFADKMWKSGIINKQCAHHIIPYTD